MHAAYTLHFKSIYPTEDKFINDPYAARFISMLPSSSATTEIKECYAILIRHYRNSEIAFENIDDFKDMFWERIEQAYPNYMLRRDRYKQLLELSDKELLSVSSHIINITNATNDVVDDPLDEPLKNITDQNASKSFGSKAERLRYQINLAQYELINDFVMRFKRLFIRFGTSSSIY